MPQHYTDPSRATEAHSLPDCETFYVSAREVRDYRKEGIDLYTAPGWYVWACFPGCLPDGDPEGPYATETEALQAWYDLCGMDY